MIAFGNGVGRLAACNRRNESETITLIVKKQKNEKFI
jgi:hypothetical protein